MPARRVLSIGQCNPDQGAITRLLLQHFDAQVKAAHTAEEGFKELKAQPMDLVLVNRRFDYDGGSGVEFVKQLKQDPELQQTPVMLVSNFEEAQQEAMRAGAVRGFGKDSLHAPQTVARLRGYLE